MLRARHAPATRPHDRRRSAPTALIIPAFERDETWPKTKAAPDTDEQPPTAMTACRRSACIAQYVKDMSFENPNAPAVYQWQGQPQMDVQFNIGAQSVGQDVHEVVLKIEITAKGDQGIAFRIELLYAGLFAVTEHAGRAAPALPARRGAAPAFPVRPPDHRRRDGRRRLPAACCSSRSISPAFTCRARRSSRPRPPAARPGT